MPENLPTIHARVSLPPGLDETRIAVVDSDAIIAETILRAADNHRPGPATWDWQLNLLHYARTSPWRPDELGGFRADPADEADMGDRGLTSGEDVAPRRDDRHM